MKIKDIVKIKGGKRLPKGNNLQTTPNNHPYIRVRDMKGKYIQNNDLEYVPDAVFPLIKNYIVNENDVIVSIVGTIGLVSIIDKKLDNASQTENCAKLSGLDKIDAEYLYYYLISDLGQEEIAKATVGAVQPKLPLYGIENIDIDWKSRVERENIVSILKSFDDKIQLNTQTNQTLEAIAQAIFKSWFVDFDPVRAKAQAILDGKTSDEANLSAMAVISGKAIEDLNQAEYQQLWEIADAFPSELVENAEFGEVPKGWEVRKVGEVLDTVGGGTPSTQNNDFWENGDIYWTTPKDLSSLTNKILLNTDRKITQAGLKKISSGLLPVNTVLLSSRAPVGYLALAKIPVAINQGYIAIKNSDILNCYYILQWCVANMNEIKGRASGTTFAEISKNTFREISIIVPNQEILDIFKNKLESIYDQITKNAKENISLAQIRDLLLPKLLSGEIEL